MIDIQKTVEKVMNSDETIERKQTALRELAVVESDNRSWMTMGHAETALTMLNAKVWIDAWPAFVVLVPGAQI